MGKFDVPAAISYALKTSAKSDGKVHHKIFYLGHSMGKSLNMNSFNKRISIDLFCLFKGTVMFWVAMNEHQSWMEDHVAVMVALGPVAHVEHVKSPIRILAPFATEFDVSHMIQFYSFNFAKLKMYHFFVVFIPSDGCERICSLKRFDTTV